MPHSATRFSNSFGFRFVRHRVVKTLNTGAAESAKCKNGKSRPAASSREITRPPVVVVVFFFLFDSRLRTT